MDNKDIPCKEHPDAPHGFMRDASHTAGRYVCECEFWEPPKNKPMTRDEWKEWLAKNGGSYKDGLAVSWAEAQGVAARGCGKGLQQGVAASCGKEWVGLTDDEVSEIIDREIGFNSCFGPEESFARAIEAKLKEKNT